MLAQHNPPGVFAPVGPYCHAIQAGPVNKLLFISGTIGLDPAGKAPKDFDAQCTQLWKNIVQILKDAQMDVTNLAKITCFIRDVKYRVPNMKIREQFLGTHKVATTVVVAQLMEDDWLVEIEAIAAA